MKKSRSKLRVGFLVLFVLLTLAPAWALDTSVDCTAAQKIQAAVDAAKAESTAGPHTINVSGNCVEFVRVLGIDNLTIRQSTDAIATLSGDPAVDPLPQAVLWVSRSDNFRLGDITVNGTPRPAILIDGFSSVTLSRFDPRPGPLSELSTCVIQNSTGSGITVRQASYVTINNCMVQNNTAVGISISDGSFATISSSTVQDNSFQGGTGGINVAGLSSLTLCNSIVRDNGMIGVSNANGINITSGSLGTLLGDNCFFSSPTTPEVEMIEIASNAGNGIGLGGDSNLSANGGHLIHDNGGRGIGAGSSSLSINGQNVGGVAYPLKIYNNGSQGVSLTSSTGSLFNVEVSGNNTAPPSISPLPPGSPSLPCGICARNSSALNGIGNATVQNNIGDGIFLDMSSTAFANPVLIIMNNTGDGIHLETGGGIRLFYPTGATNPPPPNNINGNGGYGLNCTDAISWAAGSTDGISKPLKCSVYK